MVSRVRRVYAFRRYNKPAASRRPSSYNIAIIRPRPWWGGGRSDPPSRRTPLPGRSRDPSSPARCRKTSRSGSATRPTFYNNTTRVRRTYARIHISIRVSSEIYGTVPLLHGDPVESHPGSNTPTRYKYTENLKPSTRCVYVYIYIYSSRYFYPSARG